MPNPCTCRHPEDCCPICYQQRKSVLQGKLWEATLAITSLQEEAARLERDLQLHLKQEN